VTSHPPSDIAAGPPFVYVEPSDRGAGVLGLAVAVVWNPQTRAELYDVWIDRDSASARVTPRGGAPVEAVGGNEHVQTACPEPAFRMGDAVFYCTRRAGHAGYCGHWPEEHRERGYPAGDDEAA
jgi:hypothetical protein